MKPETCGCCEPAASPTPLRIHNRPGLTSVAYRIGTFSAFRQAMLQAIAGTPELTHLRTRLSDDYAITLLELWAIVADILTFYQERFANEVFLRTARQRDSVLRLARLLDYQLRPGVAATAWLAFTLERDAKLRIPVGLRVQSVPGQGERPQKFETLEEIEAWSALNRVRVYPLPQPVNPLAAGSRGGGLRSDPQDLGAGGGLVVFREGFHNYSDTRPFREFPPVEEKRLEAIEHRDGRAAIRWSPAISRDWGDSARMFRFRRRFRLFGVDAPPSYLRAEEAAEGDARDIVWRQTDTSFLSLFWGGYSSAETPDRSEVIGNDAFDLNGTYPDLAAGSELLIVINPVLYVSLLGAARQAFVVRRRVKAVMEKTASWGPLSGPVTRVLLDGPVLPDLEFDIRNASLYELDGPEILLARRRYPDSISGDRVYAPLTDLDGLDRDRALIIGDGAGEPALVTVSDTVAVDTDGDGTADHLEIAFTPALPRPLDTAMAELRGNVTLASHGATVSGEVLGDGDAAEAFQRFALKKQPLTYVPSAATCGLRSSLQVQVNRVLWQEVPSLFGRTTSDRVYTTRIGDDGTVTLGFGDGVTGARLPSGRGNLVASYRQGAGLAGRVQAGTLRTLLDRPTGLKAAGNPLAAEGGADPESLDQARRNAPMTVRTFDRAVSLRDFEDLVKDSGEVAKARANWVWNGEARAIHLTVAGQEGALFSDDGLRRMHAGLTARRDPNRLLLLDNFRQVSVVVGATLQVDERHVAAEVEATARAALLDALSFEALEFGLPLHLSDIYAVLQGVDGVRWVDVDLFHFKDRTPAHLADRGADARPLQGHLRIYPARPDPSSGTAVLPAEQARIEAPAADVTLLTAGGLPG